MTDQTENTPEDDDDLKSAELVLGLAEGEDITQGRARMTNDGAFAQKVAWWQERLVAMTDGIAPVTPRKSVKRAVLKRVFPKVRVPLSQRLWVWQGMTLASIFVAAFVVIPQLRPSTEVAPASVFATQLTSETSPLEVLAVLDPARGDIALRRLNGGALEGRVLELWAILPDSAPVSLGVWPKGKVVRMALPQDLAVQAAVLTLAITDEPVGGAPNGAPTGAVLAAGAISEL